MKGTLVAGVVLTIIGVILLVYQGFSFTERKTVVDAGPVQVQADKTRSIPVPPIVGWIVTAGGIILTVAGLRGKS